jgi:hypothetical protein
VAALVVTGSASTSFADDAPKSWWQQITINAFASTSYTWNFNNPSTNINQLRAFDFDHNSIRIDAAELVVQKAVAAKGDFGFRLDLAMGAVAKVAAARGLFRDPVTGVAGDFDLQQAFVSYIVPVGKGLRVDAGKFVTPVGTEFIDGYDGYNDNFSRSLLFTWAIPFTHTGFKLSYPFNDKFSAMVMLVNGWDNVLDNNSAKSFGVSLTLTPIGPLAIYLNYIGGPERDHQDTDFRNLVDLGVVAHIGSRLTLMANADYGNDMNAIAPAMADPGIPMPTAPDPAAAGAGATNAQWAGVALYVRVQATKRFAAIARGEIFWDIDGFRTGVKQRIMELTLTPELKITDSLVLRGEFRIDQSDQGIFFKSDGTSTRKYQPTIALNALYAF